MVYFVIVFYCSFTQLSHGEQSIFADRSSSEVEFPGVQLHCRSTVSYMLFWYFRGAQWQVYNVLHVVLVFLRGSSAAIQCVLHDVLVFLRRFYHCDLKMKCLGMFHILICCPSFSIMVPLLLLPITRNCSFCSPCYKYSFSLLFPYFYAY